jgi:hypothetical protein
MAHLSRPETARKPDRARGLFGLTLLALLLLVLAAIIPSAARAKEADSHPPAEVSIPDTRQIQLVSRINGQRFRLRAGIKGLLSERRGTAHF